VQDFRRIEAWQLARGLTVAVYRATRHFPIDERFGLTAQLRASTKAIGSAIAEAFGRATRKDCARCLQTAISEGNETLHHLITARDLDYVSQESFEYLVALLEPVRRKTFNLLMRIRPHG
jgi:four helix bundle protein